MDRVKVFHMWRSSSPSTSLSGILLTWLEFLLSCRWRRSSSSWRAHLQDATTHFTWCPMLKPIFEDYLLASWKLLGYTWKTRQRWKFLMFPGNFKWVSGSVGLVVYCISWTFWVFSLYLSRVQNIINKTRESVQSIWWQIYDFLWLYRRTENPSYCGIGPTFGYNYQILKHVMSEWRTKKHNMLCGVGKEVAEIWSMS